MVTPLTINVDEQQPLDANLNSEKANLNSEKEKESLEFKDENSNEKSSPHNEQDIDDFLSERYDYNHTISRKIIILLLELVQSF